MRRSLLVSLLALCVSVPALAQSADFTPPPMVPSTPPPTPPNEPGVATPGTPPPPGAMPPAASPTTPAPGYQYSPYGQPKKAEKPGPEVGLMISESLFGILTGAGVGLLPYLLMDQSGFFASDNQIGTLILVLVLTAVPLAVGQTQVSLANGSRYYQSEQWPAVLAGLAGEAAFLGIYFLQGGFGSASGTSGGTPVAGGNTTLLLVGTVAIVPLLQMAVINLTKEPKMQFSALEVGKGGRLSAGIPIPAPLVAQTREGTAFGLSFSLLSGRF